MEQKEEQKDIRQKSKIENAVTRIQDNDQEDDLNLKQLSDIWRQISIDGQWFKRQIGVILLIFVGIILYISNRYGAQQEIIEEQQLESELKDSRFRALTRSSELTFNTRQSQIEQALYDMGDSTLLVSNEAPFQLGEQAEEEQKDNNDSISDEGRQE